MIVDRLARWLYARLGPRYVLALPALQIPSSLFVALGYIAIVASFYDPTASDLLIIFAGTAAFICLGMGFALRDQKRLFSELMRWRAAADPSGKQTTEAWMVATALVARSFRRNAFRVNAISAIPSVVFAVVVLGLEWPAFFVLLLASVPAAAYATVINYAQAEFLVRPVLDDIAAGLPEDFEFERTGLPLHKRLIIGLPTFTVTTGLIVAALVSGGEGTGALLLAAGVAIGVGLAVSGELSLLLSDSMIRPVQRLSEAMRRVREGDYSVRVPVDSSDELGELSDDFNRMAIGLAEREQIREAFGTYVDHEVAELLLSGGFPAEGVEVEVSIMFCDVPGFTPYAEESTPQDVVSALNELFTHAVEIIDRHGGHVDKFLGDGLLAVFGAPEGYEDHADRAVAAGIEIASETAGGDGLSLHVGINTGRVVAGSIGGAGRLNFSVIGDAVNVAARVEAATRETGDRMLFTAATRDLLVSDVDVQPRGSVELKGKADPHEVFAPKVLEATGAKPRERAR